MYAPNLGTLFSLVAERNKDSVALIFSNQRLSYGELAEKATKAAAGLVERGVRAGQVACVSGEKNPETYAQIIGCVISGIPYVMLDDCPLERQVRILERCRPAIVVGDDTYAADDVQMAAEAVNTQWTTKEQLGKRVAASSSSDFSPSGNHPAYIMFTSGSTGFPKGAVISHQNVSRLIAWSWHRFGFGPGEVLTNVNPLYFDNSLFDLYSSLFTGAALAPFTKEETLDPMGLLQGLTERGCWERPARPAAQAHCASASPPPWCPRACISSSACPRIRMASWTEGRSRNVTSTIEKRGGYLFGRGEEAP